MAMPSSTPDTNAVAPANETRERKGFVPGLGAIFLIVFLDILGFSLVLPFLAKEASETFHTTAFVGTVLSGSIYSLMQFLFVPVWGRISDRVGRRPVLLWSVLATSVGMASLGVGLVYASSVAWLFLARIWSGIATANIGTASAYIADVTKPEDRARGMGMIGMAFGLGFILGPAIGGMLSRIPIGGRMGAVPCFVAAALSIVNFAWAYFHLRESLSIDRRAKSKRSLSPLNIAAAREAFARPGVARAILVNFILILSFTILDQTFALFNARKFGITEFGTGLVLMFVGVVAASVQGALIRPLSRRYDDSVLIRVGTILQAIAFAGIAISPSFGLSALVLASGLLALGNGLTQPGIAAYVSKRADPRAQGNTLGTNQSASALARVFGPAFGGWMFQTFGPRSPYVAGALGMAVASAIALTLAAASRADAEPPATAG
ncbi:MAG: MFS transporter [Polyangiaceae bacterium]|nr:MFS transporter [Polyangiaceae bacterium]